MSLVKLRHCKWRNDERLKYRHVEWKKSLPFVFNPRGVLIHRAKSVHSNGVFADDTNTSVIYWCGNLGRDPEFYADPPADKLLCARCELLAVNAGEATADVLAGRHVHIGKAVPVRTCCPESQGIN